MFNYILSKAKYSLKLIRAISDDSIMYLFPRCGTTKTDFVGSILVSSIQSNITMIERFIFYLIL